ncbi:MAG: Asp-tRNA(Asn)/Glu-tRNA(Gln) amidotransferase subunit GatB, partial [Bacteroidota bacterium]
PNTHVSVISLGHPGTLPMVNKTAVSFAVRLGLATNSKITSHNIFARKNYFYADLPKGYQITQDKTPICTEGYITIRLADKTEKKIGLIRIHMEEDAGKSMHDQDPIDTLVDLNRAGVPLLEIVSQPEIKNGEEAYAYLNEVRKLVRYLDICDGNMEEGSLRCDANISVMLKGSKEFGKKVEVKNMNSFRNVQRAIDFEINRQIELIEAGKTISVETRGFDAVKGTTFSQRLKEEANDYRYFPEPDLPPLIITEEYIENIKKSLPELPNDLFKRFMQELNLNEYDASLLVESKEIAKYFCDLIQHTNNYKAAANWVMGDIKSYLNENALHISSFPVKPLDIASLIKIIEEGKISHSVASQKVFPEMIKSPDKKPIDIAGELNVLIERDDNALLAIVNEVIDKYPDKIAEYKAGKTSLVGMFMGEVMKKTGGKIDPKAASKLVKETLDKK